MVAVLAKESSTNWVLAVLAVALPFLGTVLGLAAGRWAEERNRRREAYAAAVRALVAWSEYPYRVRRRTDDAPDTLRRLAELGHDLQEQLQCHRAWVRSESDRVGAIYDHAISRVKAFVGPAVAKAWASPPIREASQMNLGDEKGESIDMLIENLDSAIAWRFGWRRALGLVAGPRKR